MNIQGLQKLSLLDYPQRVACTVFTGGCNLRCPFCHNAPLVLQPQQQTPLTPEELLAFLRRRQGILDGVCISGGEPLLQTDLPQLLEQIRGLGYAIKLDTNGCYPQQLAQLIENGLVDYIAMDIKNSPARYAATVGLDDFDLEPVKQSVLLLLADKVDYEFRTTVVRGLHNEQSFHDIGHWLHGARRYFLQQFVDSGQLLGADHIPDMGGFTEQEMAHFLSITQQYLPQAQLRGL